MRIQTLLSLLLLFVSLLPACVQASGGTIDVLDYRAEIAPDIATESVRGEVQIRFRSRTPALRSVRFDRGELTIDSVFDGDNALAFDTSTGVIEATLIRPLRMGETRTLRIRYRGSPRHGLQFDRVRNEAYTIFSTSQWLICIDAPSERAMLDLTLLVPHDSTVVANGRRISRRARTNGLIAHRWRLSRPTASFLYGFAIGPYREARNADGMPRLRQLSVDRSSEELERIFRDTRDILRFFEARSGVRYPGKDYTQVLVADTIGQELAGLAFLPERYGTEVLDDPDAIGLIAHEAAHQWWGDLVTCSDWGHFWLNEGFATFMTAAYLEHRRGRATYDQLVAGWRERVERLRGDGTDHALVYAEWKRPSRDDRAVVYQKGALVLHLLREELGDASFWKGIRDYTRTHAGKSVVSSDLQRAMERSSGRDLDAFFDEWVN
jgi:aminopeptidase N